MTDDYPQQVHRPRPQRSVGGVRVRVEPHPHVVALLVLGIIAANVLLAALVWLVADVRAAQRDTLAQVRELVAREK